MSLFKGLSVDTGQIQGLKRVLIFMSNILLLVTQCKIWRVILLNNMLMAKTIRKSCLKNE